MLNKSKSRELPEILRYLADRIESNPELMENIHIDVRIKEKKEVPDKIKITGYRDDADLLRALKRQNMANLKGFIRDNRLGRESNIAGLKTRAELLAYIEKRLNERHHRGDSFTEKNE